MARHLGELLDEARHEGFVGRGRELAAFDAALGGESPVRVLFTHGPGGIGKTTLLLEYWRRARQAGRGVVLVDGREVDPSPQGFIEAANAPSVLLVDGYEQLAPIDTWLRDELL